MKKIKNGLNKIGNAFLKLNQWIYYPIILQTLLLTGFVYGEMSTGMKVATGVCIILDSFIAIWNCQLKYNKDNDKNK